MLKYDWLMEYARFEYNYFGIIAVSLDVGNAKVFVFHATWVRLHPDFNNHAFKKPRKFVGQDDQHKFESGRTRVSSLNIIIMTLFVCQWS